MIKLDHPCRDTCSGWQQGRERGWAEEREACAKLAEQNYLGFMHDIKEGYSQIYGNDLAVMIRGRSVARSGEEAAGG